METIMLKRSGRIKKINADSKGVIAKLKADGYVEVVSTKEGLKELTPESIAADKSVKEIEELKVKVLELETLNGELTEQLKVSKAEVKKVKATVKKANTEK